MSGMNAKQVIDYYSRDDIAAALVRHAKDREVAGAFPSGAYSRRPGVLQYPSDVRQLAKKGATSFHFSVERWINPMAIRREDYDKLRSGWDLVIDIDSKIGMKGSLACAGIICSLFRKHGIKNIGLKFSGSRGFHISVSWDAFPKEVDYARLEKRYPEIPRIITGYIRHKIADELMRAISRMPEAKELMSALEAEPNPFYFVEIEKWGLGQMFRAPYSLNEKTWLVSLPLKYSGLGSFSIEDALPEKVEPASDFFAAEQGEAELLLSEALDWHALQKKDEKPKPAVRWEKKIPEAMFPPCIKLMLAGISDGRKRSIFTLINFLRMCNWQWQEIEERVYEWAQATGLPRSYALSQLAYHSRREPVPPANCDIELYYIDIGMCVPDSVCKAGSDKITIKNPAAYPFRKMGRMGSMQSRAYFCECGREFPSNRSLALHKGRDHAM